MNSEQIDQDSQTPKLTLLVCTRNRAERLQPFLDCVKKLKCSQPWELIMVDNGSTDTTKELLDDFSSHVISPIKTQVVYEPKKGLSRARNTGIRHSTGEIVAFTDDDCYPTATFLDDILDQFDTHDIAYLGGRVTLYDPNDLRITTKEDPEPRDLRPYSFLETGLIHGANMAIARAPLLESGGFDDRLGAGSPLKSAEDIELLARLSWCGYHGRYDPTPTVAHHHGIKKTSALKNLYKQYDHGRGAYYFLYTLNYPSRSTYLRATFNYFCASIGRDRAFGRISRELTGGLHLVTRYGLRKHQGRLGTIAD